MYSSLHVSVYSKTTRCSFLLQGDGGENAKREDCVVKREDRRRKTVVDQNKKGCPVRQLFD